MFVPPLRLALALLLFGEVTAHSQESRELEALDLDALIDSLPRVGEEWVRNAEGDLELHPVSAEMVHRLAFGALLSDEQWRRALLRTGALRWRAKWPVDCPIALSLRDPNWLVATRIQLLPRELDLRAPRMDSTIGRCAISAMSAARNWAYQELGSLPVGRHGIVFEATIERRSMHGMSLDKTSPVLWRGQLPYTVEVVEMLDDAVPPAKSPQIDSAVRGALSVVRAGEHLYETEALLVFDPDRSPETLLANMGFSLEIEWERAGTKRGGTSLVPGSDELLYASSMHADSAWAWGAPLRFPEGILDDPTELEEWSVRVRGGTAGILEQWEATTRWASVLEIPLDELLRREVTVAAEGRGAWFSW